MQPVLFPSFLEDAVPGLHQYTLGEEARLCYVSRSLCQMTGYSREELCGDQTDGYGRLVHPNDRGRYREALAGLSAGGTCTLEYRLCRKDGTILSVQDTISTACDRQGQWIATSVLADITPLREENQALRFLSDTVPCGFLRYTCQPQPSVTYLNQTMAELLRLPEQERAHWDRSIYRSNIFLLIPQEERQRFARYLEQVALSQEPLAGEMTLLRWDGTKLRVFGWVVRHQDAQGNQEFQCACVDISRSHQRKQQRALTRYLGALKTVYDRIFSFDVAAGTAMCLHCPPESHFSAIRHIPLGLEQATEKWLQESVRPEDQPELREFFARYRRADFGRDGAPPPQITYQVCQNGKVCRYRGTLLPTESSCILFCCRSLSEERETDALRLENETLRENVQALMDRFTDGGAAFVVTGRRVTPLYASDNVRGFFGFSPEQWEALRKKSTPMEEFVAHSHVPYARFAALLEDGEAEFSYEDFSAGCWRKIKAICSRRGEDPGAPRYVMLYRMSPGEDHGETEVSLRTFGYFDVFVGNQAVVFRSGKAKELLALMVDRRGGFISSGEAISFLWEDEPVSTVTLARYRKVALRLKNTLEEYGISEIVETVDGRRRIVPERVQCDLFDYLAGKRQEGHLFRGSYLTNYSWGEATLAELCGDLTLE